MKFGAIPVAEAEGAILAHAVKQGGMVLRKGTVLVATDVARLAAAGVAEVVAARLEPGDVSEDDAAGQVAAALAGAHVRLDLPHTGRVNLFAECAGVLHVDAVAIEALNTLDEAVTAATLPDFRAVVAGEMIGTVKIIPFSVPEVLAGEAARAAAGAIRISPYRARPVAVISTMLPGLKPTVVDKTLAALRERLAPTGSAIAADIRVPHDAPALAAALEAVRDAGLVIIFGASAITDRADVIPAALVASGGRIEHFGMPVDPGNLLLIGARGDVPVLGAPGCARSPRENGFDWVLQRLLADVPVTRADIRRMGVGGLLMEIVSRPQPRDPQGQHGGPLPLGVVVLAAGRSSRMGANKLLAAYQGKALVQHVAETALAAGVGPVVVVTGHQAEAVQGALQDLPVTFVHNPDFADGMATSLKAGIAALGDVAGAAILLGDMPLVSPALIGRLAAILQDNPAAQAVVPTSLGERGNPVLIGRGLFPAVAALTGDTGARRLLVEAGEQVIEVPVDDPGIHLDIDTPEALATLRGQ